MIGDRLVVEIDGREHHSSREQFEVDRRRDAALSARGYRSLRFSYRQVMHHWVTVEQAILGACVRGHHLA
jgi:very-short-patch-repair endonuclease